MISIIMKLIMKWTLEVFLCVLAIDSLLADNSLLFSQMKHKQEIVENDDHLTRKMEFNNNCSVCQVWKRPFCTGKGCFCGYSLHGVVQCDDRSSKTALLPCFCMTYSELMNKTLVGYCIFTCFHMNGYHFEIQAKENVDLNEDVCNSRRNFSRTGQMCGKCKEGYAPPVYSYSLACVKCSDYKYNWLKYIAIAFLPVTVFYVIVIVFRVSVTSSAMIGYVLCNQLIAVPAQIHFVSVSRQKSTSNDITFKFLSIVYGMWNLDFLRGVFEPFCLHPKVSFIQTLLLEYLLAVYPMFLVIITYLLVCLQDNSKIVRWCYRPFYKCFIKVRREWNIQSSLVSAFATFILLSYVKILDVTFQILTPTRLYDVNGDQLPQLYLYYNGTVEYFGKEHLPYAVLALFMFTVFNMFPLLLLCLYPCQCFQRCLNCCNIRWPSLHIFMDTFHGCYKLKPYDCRYFAAFYLALRIINYIIIIITTSVLYFPLTTVFFSIAAMVTALARPYKGHLFYTVIDTVLFANLALITSTITFYYYAHAMDPTHILNHSTPLPEIGVLPLYGLSLLIYKVIPMRIRLKVKAILCKVYQRICVNRSARNESEPEAVIEYPTHRATADDSSAPLINLSINEFEQ